MKLKKLLTIGTLLLSVGFTGNSFAIDGKIRVGVLAGPEYEVNEVVKQIAKEKYNLEVELVSFTDYVTPNIALVSKDLDINVFQHVPYLEAQSQARGWDNLVVAGKTFIWPMVAYSKKHKDISSLPDKAKVAIPNDPTNQGRALLLLAKQGLIELKDPTSLTQTILDISSNPKKLQIQSLDANLVARTLASVDFAIINTTFAAQAKLTLKDGIFKEDSDSPYANVVVARTDNKDDVDVLNFIKAFQTEQIYQKALELFDQNVVKAWE